MTEDLSLGLILDDRDDSVFAGGWSDEDEELDGEFVCTPRLVYFFSPKISYLRYLSLIKIAQICSDTQIWVDKL